MLRGCQPLAAGAAEIIAWRADQKLSRKVFRALSVNAFLDAAADSRRLLPRKCKLTDMNLEQFGFLPWDTHNPPLGMTCVAKQQVPDLVSQDIPQHDSGVIATVAVIGGHFIDGIIKNVCDHPVIRPPGCHGETKYTLVQLGQ